MSNKFFNGYPYTDFHELNLSWVIDQLRSFATTLEQFVSINALKYADPIQWNITTQYEKNTIVIDPQTGTAYISVAPVPSGVSLSNTDYWTEVFDLGGFVVRASQNLANTYEPESTTTATVSTPLGGWIVWGDRLYKTLANITAGDSYVIDGNIEALTIEDVTGHLDDLDTHDKGNLVEAINNLVRSLSSEIQNRLDADSQLHDADLAMQSNITDLQTDLTDEITTRQTADAQLHNADLVMQSDIASLQNLVGVISGKFIFIGDSYNNPQYSDWGNYTASELGLSSGDYASLYVDGGSFPNDSFNTPIITYASSLTAEEREEYTNIICCGGINDVHATADTVYNKMSTWYDLCKGYFPNARICFGYIGNSIESSSILNSRTYEKIIRTIGAYRRCRDFGATYLYGLEYVLHDYSLMSSDGIHPTASGGQQIAKYIKIALKYNKADVMRSYHSETTGSFLDTSSASAVNPITVNEIARADSQYYVDVVQDNNQQTFTYMGRIAVICDTFVTINASATIKLGSCKIPLINGKKGLVIPIRAEAKDYSDGTKYYNMKGEMVINGSNVNIYFDGAENNWEGSIAISRMIIDGFSVSADTLLF